MKKLYFVAMLLLPVGCFSKTKNLSVIEAYKKISNKIVDNDKCFYEHGKNPNFEVNEERLVQSVVISKGRKVILGICAPGAYQDRYLAFLIENEDFSKSKKLIFSLPEFDENFNNWKLVDSEVIPDLIYPQEDGKFIVYNKSSGRGTCGYVSHYDLRTISEKSVNKPIKIYANDNCSLDIGWDEWPEIKFN